jgi:acetyl-CoA acyltransferase
MPELRDAVFVDGVRLPIGRAREGGAYAGVRADDMGVRTIRALLERNPGLDPAKIDDVIFAATAQVGDQGLTMGRALAVLAGLPKEVPGYAIDRMCAGSLTTATAAADAIRVGSQDIVVAGGVEHMFNHAMGEEIDPNPRFVAEGLVDQSALVMGQTAENLHDENPHITREMADEYAAISQERAAKAIADGVFDHHMVPMTVWSDDGWKVVSQDEHPRPGTTKEDLAELPAVFRTGGRVTPGNAAGLNDGAGCVLLASPEAAEEIGEPGSMRLVDYAFIGVRPETMGYGPVPATEKLLQRNEMSIDDIDIIELHEAFAIECLLFLDHFGLPIDAEKVNPYGGSLALGHPLAMSGSRIIMQMAHYFDTHDDARYGITTACVGLGMGCTILWENI